MECNVNATCIYISYYSISGFSNILVLFIICFLWLLCLSVVCLNIVQKKIVFNSYLIACSSELCSILKHTQQNQSGIQHIAFSISSIWKKYFRWFFCQISCKWAFEVPYLSLIVLQCVELTHKPGLYLGGMEFAGSDVWLMLWDCGKHDSYSGKYVFEKINPGAV